MNRISASTFRNNLDAFIKQVTDRHEPLRVTWHGGKDLAVISADDWEREQETLHVLQSSSLMQQITDSLQTHSPGTGYKLPTAE